MLLFQKFTFSWCIVVLLVRLTSGEYTDQIITEFKEGELGGMGGRCNLDQELLEVKKYEDFETVFKKPNGANEYFATSSEGIDKHCIENVGPFKADVDFSVGVSMYTNNIGGPHSFSFLVTDLATDDVLTTEVEIDDKKWTYSLIKLTRSSTYKIRLEYTKISEDEDAFFAIDKFMITFPTPPTTTTVETTTDPPDGTSPTETPTNPTDVTPPTATPPDHTDDTTPIEAPTNPTDVTPPTKAPTNPTDGTPPTETPTDPTNGTPSTETSTDPTDSTPPTEIPTDPTDSTPPTEIPTDPTDVTPPTETPTDPTDGTPPTETPTDPTNGTPSTETSTDPSDGTPPTEIPTDPTNVTPPTETPTDPTDGTSSTETSTDPTDSTPPTEIPTDPTDATETPTDLPDSTPPTLPATDNPITISPQSDNWKIISIVVIAVCSCFIFITVFLAYSYCSIWQKVKLLISPKVSEPMGKIPRVVQRKAEEKSTLRDTPVDQNSVTIFISK